MIAGCVAASIFGLWNDWNEYFIWDEWSYWTERRPLLNAHKFAELFMRQHSGHWHGIIMGIWMPLDRVFGLKTYIPYVVPTIVAHCGAGFLLFELLCHSRIRPPVAAATAILYLFLAAAAGSVSFGWQICFVAPIALCYLALLAIERYADGEPRWLAWLTIASVVLAIVSSGVGVTVVGVTALAATARRRLALALALAASIVAIPGGAYLFWRRQCKPLFIPLRWSELGRYVSYARSGLQSTVEGVVQVHITFVAWLLIVSTVAGVIAAVIRRERYWSVFAATLAGVMLFYISLATQRSNGGRALCGVVAALRARGECAVPARVGIPGGPARGCSAMGRLRRDRACPVGPCRQHAGLRAFQRPLHRRRAADPRRDSCDRRRSRYRVDGVPGSLQPYGASAFRLSIADVRRLAAEGKLPCDADYTEVVRVAAKLVVSAPPREAVSCRTEP